MCNITVEVATSATQNSVSVISLKDFNYDPGKDSYLPEKIIIDTVNFVLPDNKADDQNSPFKCIIFDLKDVKSTSVPVAAGLKYYAPELLKASNVNVTAKGSDWTLTGIVAQNIHLGAVYARKSSYVYGNKGANCRVILENFTQVKRPYEIEGDGGLVDIRLNPASAETHYQNSPDAWKPYISVTNCVNANIYFTAKGYLKITDSSIGLLDVFTGTQFPIATKYVHLDNCIIKPVLIHPYSDLFNITGANLITNSTIDRAFGHTNNPLAVNLNNTPGTNHYLDFGANTTDFTKVVDGFFKTTSPAIVDANTATTTATVNSILNTLRDKGIIGR